MEKGVATKSTLFDKSFNKKTETKSIGQ